jgi:hypothetical protein
MKLAGQAGHHPFYTYFSPYLSGFSDRELSGHYCFLAGQVAIAGKWSKVTSSIYWLTGREPVTFTAYLSPF